MRGHTSFGFNPYDQRSSGFTLVELVISIVLIGILATVGSSMIVDSFTTTRMVNADNASTAQARYALERLAREIREIKYDSTGGNYCITTMTTTPPKLVFYKTSGAYSSTCSTNVDTVTIDTSGSNLRLGYSSTGVTSNLSNQVSSFSLAYYDIADNTTASTGAIRFVVITLTVTDPTSGQSTSQRTRVALRNA